jgi:hypothetical protein
LCLGKSRASCTKRKSDNNEREISHQSTVGFAVSAAISKQGHSSRGNELFLPAGAFAGHAALLAALASADGAWGIAQRVAAWAWSETHDESGRYAIASAAAGATNLARSTAVSTGGNARAATLATSQERPNHCASENCHRFPAGFCGWYA